MQKIKTAPILRRIKRNPRVYAGFFDFTAGVLTEPNKKHNKIKGLRLSIISNNSKLNIFLLQKCFDII